MTILKKFDRLESPGVWHAGPDAQRVDVIVSLGKSSLVISDLQDRPLAHWGLTAVVRSNPGQSPAIYHPDEDESEALEISEATFCDALAEVQKSILKSMPHPGRLRISILLVLLGVIAFLAVSWAPSALVRFAAIAVTPAKMDEIGGRMQTKLGSISGPYCATPLGATALRELSDQLKPLGIARLAVLPQDRASAIRLPGGRVVLGKSMVEDHDSQLVPAGYVVAAMALGTEQENFEYILKSAGIGPAISLLTRGSVSDEQISKMTKELLKDVPDIADATVLTNAFQKAGLSSGAFFQTLSNDPTYSGANELANASETGNDQPLIADGLWLALQEVCQTR